MLKLEGKKKVALIGSAPSSVNLAPYDDPEWFVFGCSPGAYPYAGPKAHAWMENHRWEPQIPGHMGTGQPWYTPEYVEFLVRFKGDVWMTDPVPPEVTNARVIPVAHLVGAHGPFFMSSSLSWMFAIALETPGIEEIGLWGVDMSATEEYGHQRLGCQFFIQRAIERGIRVTVPPESDLLQPGYWYGVTENSPMMIKLTARLRELKQRKQQVDAQVSNGQHESVFLSGAIDDMEYMLKTWVTDQAFLRPQLGKTGNEVRAARLHAVGEQQG